MALKTKQLDTIGKALAESLSADRSMSARLHNEPHAYSLSFVYDIQLDPLDGPNELLEFVRDEVSKSPLVASLTRKQDNLIKQLSKDMAKLKVENERLKKFETYYEMTYEINHGRKKNAVNKRES